MTRRLLSFLLGIASLAIAAELLLRLLPVSTATMTGYHHDPDLLTYPSHHRWAMATGWDLRNAQTLHANNWGFAAQHDFVPDATAVALIGDSYAEASMLRPADRPAAQLEAMLGGSRKVYALGTPGTALLDYAQRIRFASERFGVQDFVLLLERFDARQSLCGSGNVVSRCLQPTSFAPRIERAPPAGAMARLARHSALAQYLFSQLRFKPAALVKATFTRITPEDQHAATPRPGALAVDPGQAAQTRATVDAVVDAFFATVPVASLRHLVVVVDGRRTGPARTPELADLERTRLIERMRQGGATVHDLEPAYAVHAATSPRSLDVGPYDGHLNPWVSS